MSRFRHSVLPAVGLLTFFVLIVLAMVNINVPRVSGAGDTGGGGNGGGGSGGHQTRYGPYGWWVYKTGSGGPSNGFRNSPGKNSKEWNNAKGRCEKKGIYKVLVFQIRNIKGDYQGYNYNSQYARAQPGGGGWISVQEAERRFNKLSTADRDGRKFGTDVAWLCYGDAAAPSKPWSVSGKSEISKNGKDWGASELKNGRPGEVIHWRHALTNNSKNNMDKSVNWTISGDKTIATGKDRGNAGKEFVDKTNQYVIKQKDVGGKVCQHISWKPESSSSDKTKKSKEVCIDVPYNYSLEPTVVGKGNIVESGESVEVASKVNNKGPTKSRPSKWRLTEIILEKGSSAPNQSGGASANQPCSKSAGDSYFGKQKPGAVDMPSLNDNYGCQVIAGGDEAEFLPNGESDSLIGPYARPDGMPELPAGSKVCYALSVAPRSHDSDDWQHSALVCFTISKRPKVQFLGGDVRAGVSVWGEADNDPAKIVTSISAKKTAWYGSWAEYAMMATGEISAASGAGLSGASGRQGVSAAAYNSLTLANTPSFGHFGGIVASKDPVSYFKSTGELDLSGDSLEPGRTAIIKQKGTVTITGDIIYQSESLLQSAHQLPQAVIIADDIVIDQSVGRIDAWLVAKNSISTCGPVSDPTSGWLDGVNASTCTNSLRVNGPVTTSHLYLRRTHGGEAVKPNQPAEIFSLRPDAYIWGYGQSQQMGSIRTTYIRELPPRY